MSKVIKHSSLAINSPKVMTLFPRVPLPETIPAQPSVTEITENDHKEKTRHAEEEARRILEEARGHVQSLLETAREQTGVILREAREEAQSIINQAIAEGNTLKAKAVEQGYQEGYGQALQDVQGQAEQIMANAWQEAEVARQAKAAYLTNHEVEIVELALEIAAKILHREIESNSETVIAVTTAALSKVQDMSQVVVRVHPDDYPLIDRIKPELYSLIKGLRTMSIEKDDTIARGGCIVETGNGYVDARIDAQFEEVRRVICDIMNG
ncbi:FliH/SctL family protein [Heliophilum fasciatum]|uniref:FliH/SctL family protein n=1 Tax=Heliophilum fasciatum TaxID=35700 RepID=UPI001404EF14|nr:FliH/SctL family protein [Heliophilum fasciatum]MCW2277943.1 flagellar assembly protein FliH [Heliophilum fasciatum]